MIFAECSQALRWFMEHFGLHFVLWLITINYEKAAALQQKTRFADANKFIDYHAHEVAF